MIPAASRLGLLAALLIGGKQRLRLLAQALGLGELAGDALAALVEAADERLEGTEPAASPRKITKATATQNSGSAR